MSNSHSVQTERQPHSQPAAEPHARPAAQASAPRTTSPHITDLTPAQVADLANQRDMMSLGNDF